VPAARRSFEDFSTILSTSQIKKGKTGESRVLTDPIFIQNLKERNTSDSGRKKVMSRSSLIRESDRPTMGQTTYAGSAEGLTNLASAEYSVSSVY
jgi:hypothetical protein